MKSNSNNIILQPTFAYWVSKNIISILTILLLLMLGCFFPESNDYIKYIGVAICLWIVVKISYSYVDILMCTRWLVTDEQIKIYKGVFSKKTDYIELFRISDYEEKQSFLQSLTHNTTILIFSGDKSTPKLEIVGIEANTDTIDRIRERVKIQRKQNNIYEMGNR